jgi:hypothetical protein
MKSRVKLPRFLKVIWIKARTTQSVCKNSFLKGLKAIKSQKCHIFNKILPMVDPTNDREFFKQIKKHYSRFGNNTKMNLKILRHFCTSQVDGVKKLERLKIWKSNNKTKHATRFLMEIIGIEQFLKLG